MSPDILIANVDGLSKDGMFLALLFFWHIVIWAKWRFNPRRKLAAPMDEAGDLMEDVWGIVGNLVTCCRQNAGPNCCLSHLNLVGTDSGY